MLSIPFLAFILGEWGRRGGKPVSWASWSLGCHPRRPVLPVPLLGMAGPSPSWALPAWLPCSLSSLETPGGVILPRDYTLFHPPPILSIGLLFWCPTTPLPPRSGLFIPQSWVCLCLRDPLPWMREPSAFLAASRSAGSPSLTLGFGRSREKGPTLLLCLLQNWFAHPLSVGLDCALAPRVPAPALPFQPVCPDLTAQCEVALVGAP